jgi:hypothetical protein
MDAISTRALRLAQLDGLTGVGKPLAAAQLQLSKSAFTPGPTMIPADFDEADFVGYAAEAALAYGTAFVAGDGTYRIQPPSVNFQATADTTPNVLYGWVVLNTGGTAVLYAGLFDNPIPINLADDGVEVNPVLIWGR